MVPPAPEYPSIRLRDGNVMPQMGIGVYRCEAGEETVRTVTWALELGIRMVDTAAMYENEASVHDALEMHPIPRDQIFVTTKLDTEDHGYLPAYEAAEYALSETLQTSYIDLFLIHSPYGEKIVETWDALVDLQADGLVRSIGVSNFGISHLEAIRQTGRPMPVINQIEMHPLIYQRRKDLLDYCQEHGIAIEAYGSIFSGYSEFYDHPTLSNLSKRTGKSVPQILLRWALDHGFVVIPKSSSSKARQKENYDILDFTLTKEELEELDNLEGTQGFEEYWDPISDAGVDVGDLNIAAQIRAEELAEAQQAAHGHDLDDDDQEDDEEEEL